MRTNTHKSSFDPDLILVFFVIYIFYFNFSLHFTPGLHLTPGLQPAVCSLRFTLTLNFGLSRSEIWAFGTMTATIMHISKKLT